jgi:hypothetical protein
MIKVGKPTLARIEDMTTLSVSVDNGYDGTLSDLTFTFESSYENGLAIDRADGLLVCMLHWLAAHNYDVTFDLPISERLYYQIIEFIIPALKRTTKVYWPSFATPPPWKIRGNRHDLWSR